MYFVDTKTDVKNSKSEEVSHFLKEGKYRVRYRLPDEFRPWPQLQRPRNTVVMYFQRINSNLANFAGRTRKQSFSSFRRKGKRGMCLMRGVCDLWCALMLPSIEMGDRGDLEVTYFFFSLLPSPLFVSLLKLLFNYLKRKYSNYLPPTPTVHGLDHLVITLHVLDLRLCWLIGWRRDFWFQWTAESIKRESGQCYCLHWQQRAPVCGCSGRVRFGYVFYYYYLKIKIFFCSCLGTKWFPLDIRNYYFVIRFEERSYITTNRMGPVAEWNEEFCLYELLNFIRSR